MKLGVDLGGTKIEGLLLDDEGCTLWRNRLPNPNESYQSILGAIKQLVDLMQLETNLDKNVPLGICTPGTIGTNGLMRNCNSTALNGRDLLSDLQTLLKRKIKIANDANCLVLSEAKAGVARGYENIFGVIIGTGVGGGLYLNGGLVAGANSIAGEWGHNSLSAAADMNGALRPCYCGKENCVETYLSGGGLAKTYNELTGSTCSTIEIAQLADAGNDGAKQALSSYEEQLAACLAQVINIVDPELIVLGGGVSNITRLYENVPKLWAKTIFSDTIATKLLPAQLGDSSGAFGAAWLWSS